MDPVKINWFKYCIDKYLKLYGEEGNPSILINNIDAFANLLNIVTSNKKDEEIQGELLDLVGFHNFELLEAIMRKRQYIKEHIKNLNERLQTEKTASINYKGKNMSGH